MLIVVLCVAIVASGIGGGLYLALRGGDDAGDVNVETQNTPQINVEDIPDSGALTPEQIAAKVKPSVVAILTYNNTTSASGSGVVMGEDSTHTYTYFLTCAHMLDDFTNAVVQLEDETQYDADIVGYDNRTDIGVVRVKATGFTAAEFGDSTKLQVGNDVYAIGNPGGTSFTVPSRRALFPQLTGRLTASLDIHRCVSSTQRPLTPATPVVLLLMSTVR